MASEREIEAGAEALRVSLGDRCNTNLWHRSKAQAVLEAAEAVRENEAPLREF